jgi:hypothetical protein
MLWAQPAKGPNRSPMVLSTAAIFFGVRLVPVIFHESTWQEYSQCVTFHWCSPPPPFFFASDSCL